MGSHALGRAVTARPRGDGLHTPDGQRGSSVVPPRVSAAAFLRLIEVGEAAGVTVGVRRGNGARGKVYNVVKSMSLIPEMLRASMALYQAIMFGESELTRE